MNKSVKLLDKMFILNSRKVVLESNYKICPTCHLSLVRYSPKPAVRCRWDKLYSYLGLVHQTSAFYEVGTSLESLGIVCDSMKRKSDTARE